MAKKDDKDPYGPPRRQDPYVSGYRGGGEASETGQSDEGEDGCGKKTAEMIAIPVVIALTFMALRRRRK